MVRVFLAKPLLCEVCLAKFSAELPAWQSKVSDHSV